MAHPRRLRSALAGATVVVIGIAAATVGAQSGNPPNPFREVDNWAKLPAGAKWAGVISVDPAPNGDVWVFHRSTRGIRIGSARDGKVTALIPFVEPDPEKNNNAGVEGVAADAKGNVYAAEVSTNMFKRYVKQ